VGQLHNNQVWALGYVVQGATGVRCGQRNGEVGLILETDTSRARIATGHEECPAWQTGARAQPVGTGRGVWQGEPFMGTLQAGGNAHSGVFHVSLRISPTGG
jgi:hypothetical protein